ncbi:MAG: alpha/beta fold hydrolase [Thermoanaerobaculia bacterium]
MRGCFFLLILSLLTTPLAGADANEKGQVLKLDGASIYYEVRGGGSATPLVLVNGGPGFDHAYLHVSNVWDTLAQDRPVVFYDQRGNGKSSPIAAGVSNTLLDQIQDLEALRAHLGFEKIDLLGHSWGGYLVMAYAARHPERIAHLIITDSAAPKWTDTKFLFDDVFPEAMEHYKSFDFADALGDKAASAAQIHDYLGLLFYDQKKRDEFLAQSSSFVFTKSVNAALNADLARFDLNPELPRFRFPTLVITGRFDMNVAPSVAWKIHQAIPGSRFVVFERSGHLPFFEEPEAFARTVKDFLRSGAAER